jgi:hypothetical protein
MTAVHVLWNTKNLLTAIMGIAAVTFGLLAFDAERALNELKQTTAYAHDTHEQLTAMAVTVKRLDTTSDRMAAMVDEHEKRITILETIGGRVKAPSPEK